MAWRSRPWRACAGHWGRTCTRPTVSWSPRPRSPPCTSLSLSTRHLYVSGGELLLTTGLILPTSRIGWERYVSRLKSIGIAALGIGLGPRYSEPPDALVEACKASGLSLLIVPDPTPFLTISKTYWTARARSSAQHFQDEVAAHRALIDAAASPDPPAEVLRRLARAVDGWAASLTSTGKLDQIHPAGMVEEAEALQSEIERLEVAGIHSAASFVAHGRYVAILPLSVEQTVVGYLAVGTAEQLSATHRRIVLTAVALLSIDSIRWQRTAPSARGDGPLRREPGRPWAH